MTQPTTSTTTSTTTTVPQPGVTTNNSPPVTTGLVGIPRTLQIDGKSYTVTATMSGKGIEFSDEHWATMNTQITELFSGKLPANGRAFDKADLTLRKNPTDTYEFVSAKYHLEGDDDTTETVLSKERFDGLSNKDVIQSNLNAIGSTVSSIFHKKFPTQAGTSNTTGQPQTFNNPLANINLSAQNKVGSAIQAAQVHYNRINTMSRPHGNIFYQMEEQIKHLPIKFGREISTTVLGIDKGLELTLRGEYADEILKNTEKYTEATKFNAIHDNLKNILSDVVERHRFLKLANEHLNAMLIGKTKLTQVEIESALTANGTITESQKEDFIKLYGYYVREGGDIINEELFLNNFHVKHPGYQYAIVGSDGNVSKCSANSFVASDCLFYQKPGAALLNPVEPRVVEVVDDSDSEVQNKRIQFNCDAGYGNELWVYGNGPGMSWERPTKLSNNGNDWFLNFDALAGGFDYKFQRGPKFGNKTWETGIGDGNRRYEPTASETIDITNLRF